jgi:2-polyprenyl-6-hydroxyphenyl methylase/3-demethylubiquinone-9 3-methyltransferase
MNPSSRSSRILWTCGGQTKLARRTISRTTLQLPCRTTIQTSAGNCKSIMLNPQPSRSFSSRSSVSEAEVHKFSQFSKVWWDPRKNPLIGMNPIRVEYLVDQIRAKKQNSKGATATAATTSCQPFKGLSALDVGCGGGLLSESLARLGASVTAVDPSQELVEEARRHSQLDPAVASAIDYRGGWTVEQLAKELSRTETQFDVICLLEVIEHVTDVDSILDAVSSLLKPNGTLFVSTINRTLKSKVVAIVGAEYIMGYLPPGTHDWRQFRTPQEFQAQVERAGLEQVHVSGMVLTSPPFFGQWNWRLDPNDTDVNWIGAYQHAQQTQTTE